MVAGETKPYRPVLPDISGTDTNPEIVGLIQECWAENPDDRPDFDGVRKRLRVMNKGKWVNLILYIDNHFEFVTSFQDKEHILYFLESLMQVSKYISLY